MKKMTYALLLLPIVWSSSLTAATDVRFGLKAGYSLSTQYGIDVPDIPYTVDSNYRHAVAGGLMVYFPITDSFGLQQEILYVMKGSREDIVMKAQSVTTHTEYNLNYLELPFVLRYKFLKLKNFKIYGSSGFALSILLNGKSELNGVVDMGGIQIPFAESTKLEGVDIFDYGFLYGLGAEFELFKKKCFFEYRFTIGWNTLIMPTSAGQAPAPLRNQNYVFALGVYL
ncbi:MAG: PorT family protein [Candidatus Aminicenantes bacterium]|nr:PorT family protein [Candidatus Aminicenantes bacterium]